MTDCYSCDGRGWFPVELPWETCQAVDPEEGMICDHGWWGPLYGCTVCGGGGAKKGRGRFIRFPSEIVALAEACQRAAGERVKCPECNGKKRVHRWKDCPPPGCCGTGTVPAEQPTFALHDALEEAGFPELAEHFSERCPYCKDADFTMGDYGGPITLPQLKPYLQSKCACKGTRVARHPAGCWALTLILGKS